MTETKTDKSLFYLYGLVPTEELKDKPLMPLAGIDEQHHLYERQIGEVTAILCEIDEEEFSEEVIEDKVNHDMEWLQAKALHHHETLVKLHNNYTLIPLKFCTIYKSEQNLARTIESEGLKFHQLFENIAQKEEWNLKIYCDDKKIKEEVVEHSSDIKEQEKAIETLSPGRQFFERKKWKQKIEEAVVNVKRSKCDEIHKSLTGLCSQSDVKKNWSQEMSGRKQDMNWNGIYLLNENKRDTFLQQVKHLQKEYKELGFTMEYTGPWPCYHFANL
ncbi:gas vesicle protein GvpL [Bacillus sp. RO2]|uniref:GvpL/GvpF family gas vesicle protein n=1 Tax=Bacillus sp. RO2 TaxID=2723913 RepID=UPI00145ECC75|nr:GvpL/GvpF family gas vesicle protein [Bacillus sp. RO2]NMH75440.1 gas vesicle protein GvpL [Bacillus sp. RO2]